MNIALWIIAGLLAVAFAGAGFMKLTKPKAELEADMAWVQDFDANQVRLIGLAEVLGAIGLILPPLLGIATILTPLAALGLWITMVGAIYVHIRRGDPTSAIVPAAVLGILAGIVAIARFGPQPF